jgi:hypothetical protein
MIDILLLSNESKNKLLGLQNSNLGNDLRGFSNLDPATRELAQHGLIKHKTYQVPAPTIEYYVDMKGIAHYVQITEGYWMLTVKGKTITCQLKLLKLILLLCKRIKKQFSHSSKPPKP